MNAHIDAMGSGKAAFDSSALARYATCAQSATKLNLQPAESLEDVDLFDSLLEGSREQTRIELAERIVAGLTSAAKMGFARRISFELPRELQLQLLKDIERG